MFVQPHFLGRKMTTFYLNCSQLLLPPAEQLNGYPVRVARYNISKIYVDQEEPKHYIEANIETYTCINNLDRVQYFCTGPCLI